MANEITVEGKYFMYKGRPLVRENNMICYGNMQDKYVLFLMLMGKKEIETSDPAIKVSVPENIVGQIISTDTSLPSHKRMVEQFTRKDFGDALEFGIIRLERANRDQNKN